MSDTHAGALASGDHHTNAPAGTMPPIAQRCQRRDTTALVAPETVGPLGDKIIGIIGTGRRMTMMRRYLGEQASPPSLSVGLRVDHRDIGGPVRQVARQSAGISLASANRFESISISISRDDDTESRARARYHAEHQVLARRRDVTLVDLDGVPGQPGRTDEIRIEYWNQHGVGQETVVVFDDVNAVQEVASDLQGDIDRQTSFVADWCTVHDCHAEDPLHGFQYRVCAFRVATLVENVGVLARLADQCAPVTAMSDDDDRH